jgi:tetratricopeptide (TPR) repeat protein
MHRTAAAQASAGSGDGRKIGVECEEKVVESGIRHESLIQGTPLKVETTMANSGRNDPCPCGSGKKYKRCCLEKDAASEREALAARVKPASPWSWVRSPEISAEMREAVATATGDDDDDELETASNAAVDLVHAGKLDEAEKAARDLLERFPDVHDGYDRLGMVHEARGQPKEAADCYRKVIEIIRANGDAYDQEFADVFVKLVARLDPPTGGS